ncbi:flavodoxin family protein [Rhodococcus sp. 077-4]|uniref:flavodoxin family protein n=1 Tax=Rhodococcus sp. 077-4 TaxID=2789271 RepID=UPI0039F4B68E
MFGSCSIPTNSGTGGDAIHSRALRRQRSMKRHSSRLIVYVSGPHHNTAKVAETMGSVLDAIVTTPDRIDPAQIADCEFVGFGSGTYMGKHHRQLLSFVESLPAISGQRAFTFATSGFPESGLHRFSRSLTLPLERKGFVVSSSFSCRAHDTFLPFKVVGGIHKSHPDDADLRSARRFAETLLTSACAPTPGKDSR